MSSLFTWSLSDTIVIFANTVFESVTAERRERLAKPPFSIATRFHENLFTKDSSRTFLSFNTSSLKEFETCHCIIEFAGILVGTFAGFLIVTSSVNVQEKFANRITAILLDTPMVPAFCS